MNAQMLYIFSNKYEFLVQNNNTKISNGVQMSIIINVIIIFKGTDLLINLSSVSI